MKQTNQRLPLWEFFYFLWVKQQQQVFDALDSVFCNWGPTCTVDYLVVEMKRHRILKCECEEVAHDSGEKHKQQL